MALVSCENDSRTTDIPKLRARHWILQDCDRDVAAEHNLAAINFGFAEAAFQATTMMAHHIFVNCLLLMLVRRAQTFTPRFSSHTGRYASIQLKNTAQDVSGWAVLRQLDDAAKDFDGLMPSGGPDHRCGYVSIVGAPNMGKSTLLNALIEEELCVATRRPQTTRHAILGLISSDSCQLCLIDTPGIIDQPAYKLQEGMMEAVVGAFRDADVFLVVTDLFSTPIPNDVLFERVKQSNKPVVVAINKVDLMNVVNPDSEENQQEGRTVTVEEAVFKWRTLLPEAEAIIPVSASDGIDNDGVVALRTLLMGGPDVPAALRNLGRPIPGMFQDDLKIINDHRAKQLLPLGPPLYYADTLTDRTDR